LSKQYGGLFTPTEQLNEHKDSGQNWYPLNHLRPVVNWTMEDDEEANFRAWILGPMCHMTSLMLHEQRSHLAHINAIGELCAQFRRGILAVIRSLGRDSVIRIVEAYHALHPESSKSCWYPDVFGQMDGPEWQQLYVNAEHDENAGVITISRESYNGDVDLELNRAIDWLKAEGIERVVVTGDFHLSTQMVGADTSDFFSALADPEAGTRISESWSRTARRLHDEFRVSVGFINGKRCLGGFLELLMHCHYLVSVDDAALGMPEVTLPVVPGMEGCHWPFRKTSPEHWPKLLKLLLEGTTVRATDAVGWLIDYSAPPDDALRIVWQVAIGGKHGLSLREVEGRAVEGIPKEISALSPAGDPGVEAARQAIVASIAESSGSTLSDALTVQAKHSAGFLAGPYCRKGAIGAMYARTMTV
jgi:enoyl-CoA hydratase/carnithine racemase